MQTMLTRKSALLSVLVMALLTACATSASNCPPPAPKLQWSPAQDGGVCLGATATANLLDYLDALERCSK